MKDRFKKAYLFLLHNQVNILLGGVFMLALKQVLFFIIMIKSDSISLSHAFNLIFSLLIIIILVILLVKYFNKKLSIIKNERDTIHQNYLDQEAKINKIRHEILQIKQEKFGREESTEEVVKKTEATIYKGLKQNELLDVISFFKRFCLVFDVGIGILYEEKIEVIKPIADFGLPLKNQNSYLLNEGIIGAVAKTCDPINLCNLPGEYFDTFSGLGKATPRNLQVFKISNYVFELATLSPLDNQIILALNIIVTRGFQK